jgi:hypothetical protein
MADLIRGRHLEAAQDAPLLAAANWATHQRSVTITRDYATDRPTLREALLANAKGEPTGANLA